jgi:hypothetical protein
MSGILDRSLLFLTVWTLMTRGRMMTKSPFGENARLEAYPDAFALGRTPSNFPVVLLWWLTKMIWTIYSQSL